MHTLWQLWQSTVGKKFLVAASGVLLWGWVVLHALGNLTVFGGATAIDGYAAKLRETGPLLWAVRAGLLMAAIVHVAGAVALTRAARAAKPVGYAVRSTRASTVASRTMRWSGGLLLAFIVYHLLHMTFGVVHPDFRHGGVYHNIGTGLSQPATALVYVVAVVLLGLHLYHGLWAVTRSLGVRQRSAGRLGRPVVAVLAGGLTVAFAVVPVAVLLGVVS